MRFLDPNVWYRPGGSGSFTLSDALRVLFNVQHPTSLEETYKEIRPCFDFTSAALSGHVQQSANDTLQVLLFRLTSNL